jgi:DNA-binding CsgD family transcriptional regulator
MDKKKQPQEMIYEKRAMPCILIFDLDDRLLYACNKVEALLKDFKNSTAGTKKQKPLPREIYQLCKDIGKKVPVNTVKDQHYTSSFSCNGRMYIIRAKPLFRPRDKRNPYCKMIIVEKCSRGRNFELDYEECTKRYHLTRREFEVIGKIIKGLTNQEISSSLSISNHTVKDHIKKIMFKLGVHTRSAVISRVLE